MKKLLSFIGFILLCTGVYAQSLVADGKLNPANAAEAFADVVFSQMTDMMYDRQQYRQAVELGRECADWFSSLPDEVKAEIDWYWYLYILMCEASARDGQLDEAVGYLRQVLDNGCDHYRYLLDLEVIENLASCEPFRQAVSGLRDEAGFVDILRRDHSYVTSGNRDALPVFTYAGKEEPKLAKVRQELGLEAIAGDGDEISRIVNILDWVKRTVPHNGAKQYRGEPNALAIYDYNSRTGNGVNCRMLATMLNECYLAMGYPSRVITCLPESGDDMDCHVINAVWSEDLGKWLWMDPSYGAYVTDGNGNLLGIGEVRQRLIGGLPVHVREGANWNNLNNITDDYYLQQYMAKNLYGIHCSNAYGFNTEWEMDIDFVLLIPNGKEHWMDADILTSDPQYFWQQPAGR